MRHERSAARSYGQSRIPRLGAGKRGAPRTRRAARLRLHHLSLHRPCRRSQRPRSISRAGAIGITDSFLDACFQREIEIGKIDADRALAALERLPIIFEVFVIHPDGDGLRIDFRDAGLIEKSRQPEWQPDWRTGCCVRPARLDRWQPPCPTSCVETRGRRANPTRRPQRCRRAW